MGFESGELELDSGVADLVDVAEVVRIGLDSGEVESNFLVPETICR